MDVFIVVVLLATVALRVVFVAVFAYLVLPRSTACPHCGATVSQVHPGRLGLLSGLERRFCLDCGWAGVGRRTRRPAPSATDPVDPG